MTDEEKSMAAVRFVAQQALTTLPTLPASKKITLFDGISQILSGPEAEQAHHAAFLIEEAERAQQTFLTILEGGGI